VKSGLAALPITAIEINLSPKNRINSWQNPSIPSLNLEGIANASSPDNSCSRPFIASPFANGCVSRFSQELSPLLRFA